MRRLLVILILLITAFPTAFGRTQQSNEAVANDLKQTPAYGVLALRKVDVEAELVRAREMFTEQHPSVQLKKFELDVLNREIERLLATDVSRAPKLGANYASFVLRKVAIEVELENLSHMFTPEHSDLKMKEVELSLIEHEIQKLIH